jgi:sugar phosphate permease
MFITFTPEFAKDMGMSVLPTAGSAVFFSYAGLAVGDLMSGLVSQYLRSRKKAIAIFLCLMMISIGLYFGVPHDSLFVYYTLCFLLGIGAGYWAMFVQIGAEQFGTNIRATAAISLPNMVRGMVIPITISFHAMSPMLGVTGAGLAVMAVLFVFAFLSLRMLRETFDTDLDYVER